MTVLCSRSFSASCNFTSALARYECSGRKLFPVLRSGWTKSVKSPRLIPYRRLRRFSSPQNLRDFQKFVFSSQFAIDVRREGYRDSQWTTSQAYYNSQWHYTATPNDNIRRMRKNLRIVMSTRTIADFLYFEKVVSQRVKQRKELW